MKNKLLKGIMIGVSGVVVLAGTIAATINSATSATDGDVITAQAWNDLVSKISSSGSGGSGTNCTSEGQIGCNITKTGDGGNSGLWTCTHGWNTSENACNDPSGPVIGANTVLQMDFESGLVDYAGHSLTTDGVTIVDTDCKFGSCAQFSSAEGIMVEDSNDWYFEGVDFTMELWVKGVGAGNVYLMGQGDDRNSNRLRLVKSGGYNIVEPRITGSSGVTGGWDHLAIVKDGSTLTLYLNGNSIGSLDVTNYTFNNYGDTMNIGSGSAGSNGFLSDFSGKIDDVRIVKGQAIVPNNPLSRTTSFGE